MSRPSRRPPRPAASLPSTVSPYRRWATRGAAATPTPTRAAGTTRARVAARCRRWRRSSCSSWPSRSSPSPYPRRGSRASTTPEASAPPPADPSATPRYEHLTSAPPSPLASSIRSLVHSSGDEMEDSEGGESRALILGHNARIRFLVYVVDLIDRKSVV